MYVNNHPAMPDKEQITGKVNIYVLRNQQNSTAITETDRRGDDDAFAAEAICADNDQ